MKTLLFIPVISLCVCTLQAQSIPAIPQSMVFTAGTTARDTGGQDWAFLLWEAPGADLLGGKAFAIYGKAGNSAAAAPFAREGVVQGRLDPTLIGPLIKRAELLGQNLQAFDALIVGLHKSAYYPDAAPTLPPNRVNRIVTVLSKAHSLPNMISTLRKMAMMNATLALCLGSAWVAPMPASTKTYELREWDLTAGSDGAVVGRVTLTGGAPVMLPATAQPVQMPDTTESGDLCVHLRWGVPDELKRRIILHQGFSLWRMPWSLAQSRGYHATPPTLAQLRAGVAAGDVKQVTTAPLFVSKPLSPEQSADLTYRPDRTYYTDNNGRLESPVNYVPPADGAEYGYIVTPRDLLGRDGLPSLAGRGQFGKTRRPPVPSGAAVAIACSNADVDGVRPQFFHFTFNENPADAGNPTTSYEIYRGTGPIQDDFGNPIATNLVQQMAHNGTGSRQYDHLPPYPFGVGEQVWFCVRAVRVSALGVYVSDLSPPVYATLQKHEPPPAPASASLSRSFCPQPGVILATKDLVAGETAPDDGLNHFRMVCDRLDNEVKWASFSYQPLNGEEVLIDQIEFAGNDRVQVDFSLPDADVGKDTTFICRVDDRDGSLEVPGWTEVRSAGALQTNQVYALNFLCAVMTPTALDTADPVSEYFLSRDSTVGLDTVTVTPGLPYITGTAANPPFSLGYAVERKFNVSTPAALAFGNFTWKGVGFAKLYASPTGDVFVFQDSTPAGSSTVASDYRIIPLNRLRHCQTTVPPHVAASDKKGTATKLRVCMANDPLVGALEYRFFRRIDDGPLVLYAEGRLPTGVGSNPICADDFKLPAMGGRLSYYGQMVGSNGAGSAMTLLDTFDVGQQDLPRPVLAPPRGGGTADEPKVQLRWTCPPDGVDRFEITIIPKSGAAITNAVPSVASKFVSVNRRRQKPKVNPLLINFVPAVNLQSLLTDRIGSATMGSGPAFALDLDVQTNTSYEISVQAVAKTGNPAPGSAVYTFEWKLPPSVVDADVPWPFRTLPEVVAPPFLIRAANLTAPAKLWPPGPSQVGVQIGQFGGDYAVDFAWVLDGADQPIGLGIPASVSRLQLGIGNYIFRYPVAQNRSLLPAILYRQQIANDDWPVVSGDVIQVSPLVTNLLCTEDPGHDYATVLRDPFIGVAPILINDSQVKGIYLLDTTPRAVGASYRYWLVCFDEATGTPSYVIPTTLSEVTP